jgi:uncharacterized protein (TIGR02270 family)
MHNAPMLLHILEEHFEEAAFLYEHRLGLLNDPEVAWPDIAGFEERLDAHVDGLVLGGARALSLCREQALAGDSSDLYAAVRVFCHHDRMDLVNATIESLDANDAPKVMAVSHAMISALPEHRHGETIQALDDMQANALCVLPRVIGHRRLNAVGALVRVLHDCPPARAAGALWALGRLRAAEARPAVQAYLEHSDPEVGMHAALTLLRCGQSLSRGACLRDDGFKSWSLLAVGIEGDRTHVPALIEHVRRTPSDDACIALGLLGDITAVAPLCRLLSEGQAAGSAALALNLITGADLFEELFVPEQMDPEEFFEGETAPPRNGEKMRERPPGSTVMRLSQNADAWHAWWREHHQAFEPGTCYRGGRPCAPAVLLDEMRKPGNARMVRQMAYEEMVVRFGIDVAFETDMPVPRQQAALAAYQRMID